MHPSVQRAVLQWPPRRQAGYDRLATFIVRIDVLGGEQVRSLRAGHVLQYPLSALFLTDALETGPVFFRFDHPLFAWQMIWQHLPEAFGGAGAALP